MVDTPPHERWEVHYEGTVQGVGFRYTARRIAARLDLAGYVKNLPDGRVRLVVEGPPDELARMMDGVHAVLGRYVARTTRDVCPATGEFEGFDIRF